MNAPLCSRRRFLIMGAVTIVAIPAGMCMPNGDAEAKESALHKLPTDNPQAKALGYVEDAAAVRRSNYKAGSNCSNCRFFAASNGACSLFPGFSVAAEGWCTAWAKRPEKH
jgi:High potential iron-sulfur protein